MKPETKLNEKKSLPVFSFNLLFNKSSNPVLVYSSSGMIIRANQNACKLFGYKSAQIKNISINYLFDFQNPITKKAFASVSKSNRYYGKIMLLINGSKKVFYVTLSIHYKLLEEKFFIAIFQLPSLPKPITTRKQNFNEFLLGGQLSHNLFLNFPLPMWIYDLRTLKFIAVNNAAVLNYGYSRKEFLNMTLKDIRPPEDIPKLLNNIKTQKKILQNDRSFRHRKKDGSIIYVEITSSALPSANRNKLRLVMASDITLSKLAEIKLRESESKFRSIIEASPVPCALNDEQQNITYLNAEFVKTFGYDLEDIPTLTYWWTRAYPDAEHRQWAATTWQAHLEKAQQTNAPFEPFEVNIRCKNGSLRTAILSAAPLGETFKGVHLVKFFDITERKKAEAAVKKERDQAQQYLDIAAVMIIALNAGGEIILINKKGCNILGYVDPHELLGRNWFEVCLSESIRDRVWAVFNQLIAGGIEPVEYYENPVLTKTGDERIIAFHNTVLRDSALQIIGILFSGEDITERKRVEEALRTSEERYLKLVETSPDGITVVGLDGLISYVSPKILEIYGCAHENEIIGHSPMEWIAPQDQERAKTNIGNVFKGIYTTHNRYRLLKKDGSAFWGEINSSVLTDVQGNPAGMIAITRDVSERVRAEEELHKSEARFRAFVDQATEIMVMHDFSGRILDVNEQACRSLGYSREEMLRMGVFDLEKDFDLAGAQAAWSQERPGESSTMLGHHHRKDGTAFPVEVQFGCFEFQGERYYLGIARDISERIIAEEALRKSEEKYRSLFDNANDAMYIIDPKTTRIIDCNKQATRMDGYSLDELKTMSTLDLHPADERSLLPERFKAVGEHGAMSGISGLHHQHKDGHLVPIEVNASMIGIGGEVLNLSIVRDITERKRAEERQASLSRILEESLNEIYIFSFEDLKFIEVNKGGRINTGYSIEEFREMTPLDIKPELTQKYFNDLISPLRTGEQEKIVFETIHRRKDGSNYQVEVHLQCGTYETKSVFVSIILDITDRKRAVEDLIESKLQLESAINASNTGLWDWDLKTNKVYFSPEWKKQIGYEDHEISNDFSEWQNRVHPDDLDTAFRNVQEFIKNPYPNFENEFRFRHKDGSYRWILAKSSLLYDEQGKPTRMLGSHLDITVRKQTEEALHNNHERLQKVLEVETVGVMFWDLATGDLTDANDTFLRFMGYSRSEMEAGELTWQKLTPPEYVEASLAELQKFRESGRVGPYEKEYIRKDGTRRWFVFAGSSIGGNACVGFCVDITDRKRAEEDRRSLIFRLNESEELLKNKAAHQLHDQVGQNLTALSINLNYINSQLTNEEKRMFGKRINDSISVLGNTIEQIRNIMTDLRPSVLDDHGLSSAIIWALNTFTERTNIKTQYSGGDLVPRLPVNIAYILFRVFQEALHNIMKHSKAKNVFVQLKEFDKKIIIIIQDDGIGFDIESSKTKPGHGYGLLEMEERMTLTGGKFNISSETNIGTTITLEITR